MMSDDRSYRQAFYDDYVSGHPRGVIVDALSEPDYLDVISHFPSDRESAILDVGCGQGQLVALLDRYGYKNVSGIDPSPEQVAIAHARGRLGVQLGTLFDASAAEPGAYDVVTAIDVLEHFDRQEVQRVFQAFSDLLKPGGTFVFKTPNGSSPFAGRILHGDLTHGIIYTRESLNQVGHLTGFERMKITPVRPLGTTWRRRFRRLAWSMIERALKVPLIVETGVIRGHIVTQNLVGVAIKRL